MEAIILAGGFGTRLKSVINDCPKPMAPINGRPFLEILLKNLSNKGFKRVILSLHYQSEKIRNHFGMSRISQVGALAALEDYESWKGKISPGGFLVIHDVFPNPADGGRPPFEIYTLAKESSEFEDLGIYETLGILKKN